MIIPKLWGLIAYNRPQENLELKGRRFRKLKILLVIYQNNLLSNWMKLYKIYIFICHLKLGRYGYLGVVVIFCLYLSFDWDSPLY